MKKLLTVAVLLAMVTAGGAAAEHGVERVILASDENYPDAFLGSAAAANSGLPVLLSDRDEVPQATLDAIASFNASEVVMVGGEAVLSADVRTQLEAEGYNVTRLWGFTRYGTAVQVAEHFWPAGADEAILVENDLDDQEGRVLAQARSLARTNNAPILLTPEDSIPEDVLSELQDLGVSSVTAVGVELSDSAIDQLNAINVSVSDSISGSSPDAVQRRIVNMMADDINASETLNVVAATDFRHSIAAANNPMGNAYIVGSSEDIGGAVGFVQNNSINRVRVVGNPDLTTQIADRIAAETDATVERRPVEAAEAVRYAANFSGQDIADIRAANQRLQQAQSEDLEQHQQALQRRANRTLQRAAKLTDEYNVSDDVLDELSEARSAYGAGEYLEAFRTAQEVVREVREQRYEAFEGNRSEISQAVRSETNSLQEEVADIRELNQEFADEMSANLTVEERLEIISEFKERRRETVQELIAAARSRGEGDMAERFRDVQRERTASGRERFRFMCAEEDAPAPGNASLEVEGHDGYVAVEGQLGLNTPNYRGYAETSRDGSTVSIDVVLRPTDGVGVQCTGVGEIEVRERLAAGNYSVQTTVTVDGEEVVSRQDDVTVGMGDDDEMERPERDEDSGMTLPASTVEDAEGDAADGVVTVEGITRGPAWVVVHRDDGGSPGDVIAHSDVLSEGEFEINVSANVSSGASYWAMLHNDDGDGTYEFPGNDTPMTVDNETVMLQFTVEGDGSDGNTSDDTDETIVQYTSDGFQPQQVTIDVGDAVRWVNEGSTSMWVASAVHPTHAEYDNTTRSEHCSNGTSTSFDSCQVREEYMFTFQENGSFAYHNHEQAGHTGTVVVEE